MPRVIVDPAVGVPCSVTGPPTVGADRPRWSTIHTGRPIGRSRRRLPAVSATSTRCCPAGASSGPRFRTWAAAEIATAQSASTVGRGRKGRRSHRDPELGRQQVRQLRRQRSLRLRDHRRRLGRAVRGERGGDGHRPRPARQEAGGERGPRAHTPIIMPIAPAVDPSRPGDPHAVSTQLGRTTSWTPSHVARESISASTALRICLVNGTSSWIASTNRTPAWRSAVASSLPMKRSP